ncbi:MAG: NAD(P)H-dependent oxidoreductase subunit E [Phycisphaerales bacterium]|nr:NAD(P)H-dependent oxidoreductase subunit E [Phycisphaerales bacterium]MCB9863816.1 NAD(P)H-dependent oxidoreductase subunit E [Phycisphaerales bacterium]
MAWKALDRTKAPYDKDAAPVLSDAVREKIRSFFPRYETKRAALLPALHVVQDTLGHVSLKAMAEIAEVLEIPPSSVLDTLTFYTHFWDHEKGGKVIVGCRSLSCQLMGAEKVLDAIKSELGIDEHETTKDGKYSLITEECLAACDHGPCLLINEKLHKCVKPEDVAKILKDEKNAVIDPPRSDLFDAPKDAPPAAGAGGVGKTSDIQEMRES